jgi:hypothetical protein
VGGNALAKYCQATSAISIFYCVMVYFYFWVVDCLSFLDSIERGDALILEEKELLHYGIIRRSGRYPWGSGKNENTHNKLLLDHIEMLQEKGLSEKEIANGLGMSVKELRAERSIVRNQTRQAQIGLAQRYKDKGWGPTAIGERMKIPESTVRSYLAPGAKDKADVLETTSKMLMSEVDKKGIVDVGRGVENYVGVKRSRFDVAVEMAKMHGYEVHTVPQRQVATGENTQRKVLCTPGMTQKQAWENRDNIQLIQSYSETGGRSFAVLHPPLKINPKRVGIVYGPDGGNQADGMIYVRPGVKDVSLNGAKYAQVRVAVGDDHFLKGMAVYKDDLPSGVDIQFHTKKEDSGNKLDAMKKNESEGYGPNGEHPLLRSTKRQITDNTGTPDEHVISAMNLVNEPGEWEKWSKNLSSQMLSKQSRQLAKTQLDMTYEKREFQYQDIMKLTNEVVRKRLLKNFSEATDAAAVHLKAAALPRVGNHVILPIPSMKPNEIYARNYSNGERVVLIRHPHGGPFEIPELIVNNKHAEARRLLGDSRDAVGINHVVAQRLSGADFDGDTVLVIPNDRGHITTAPALEGLKDFDPQASYPEFPGMKVMSNTQTEMGKISNLITDMALAGAPSSHMVRAVKHSMVVIDAEKHRLDYRRSANDLGIKDLKEKYQSGGASTIISRAGSEQRVPHRKPRSAAEGGPINKETGQLEWVPTGKPNYKTGKPLTKKSSRMAETTDAFTLVTQGHPMELLYATHANKLKALATKARLSYVNTPAPKQSPSAKEVYKKEVASLNTKLDLAQRNAPLERQAQALANANISARYNANPTMDKDTLKKIKFQALEEARTRTGAKKHQVKFSDDEWNAIQAGAISAHKLNQILDHADMESVYEHATPKTDILMTPTRKARADAMEAAGYERADIAKQLGVSLSTLDKAMKG